MPLTDHDIELIDKYLRDALDDENLNEFNKKLENPDFRAAVQERKAIIIAFRAQEKAQLRDEIYRLVNKTGSSRIGHWQLAAAITIISIIGYFIYTTTSVIDYQELYNEYYEPYPVSIQRGGEDKNLSDGLNLYVEGNYSEALSKFLNIKSSKPILHIYIGSCYLELEETNLAIESFNAAMNSDDEIIRQHAEWYLLLAYLKNQNLQETKNLSQKIIKNKSIYEDQVKKLIDKF